MRKIIRSTFASAAVALVFMVGLSIGESPIAMAQSMNINATGGYGTTIDHAGTQGSFIYSEEAIPQDKAKNKMTK